MSYLDYIEDSYRIIEECEQEKEKYFFYILGKKFIIYPGVFSPKYFSDVEFFAKELNINKGEEVLEIGCGIGVMSVFAALRGAKRVVAGDINPIAVENAKENAKIHNVDDRIKVLVSDVYDNIPKQKFDMILWNIPFTYFKKNKDEDLTMLQRGICDLEYYGFRRFIRGAREFLKQDGRLLIGFSREMGNWREFQKILQENNFKIKTEKKYIAEQGNPKGVRGKYRLVEYNFFEVVSCK